MATANQVNHMKKIKEDICNCLQTSSRIKILAAADWKL